MIGVADVRAHANACGAAWPLLNFSIERAAAMQPPPADPLPTVQLPGKIGPRPAHLFKAVPQEKDVCWWWRIHGPLLFCLATLVSLCSFCIFF